MQLRKILSRTQSAEDVNAPRRHTPWIETPLDTSALSQKSGMSTPPNRIDEAKTAHGNEKALNFSLPHHSDPDHPPFKRHHESSTVELFYDLFFVANLATFTSNHEIVDKHSLQNYLGFFTILWFTWLETSLFDVRFAADSVFNRICKAVSFGTMTGFAVTGAIYDTNNVGENIKAFRALSLILMVSRLALVIQYAVVFFYVRTYKSTWAPLLSTMGVLSVAAFIYLGTYFGYDLGNTGDSFPNQTGGPKTYIAYYIVCCFEALFVIGISCFWRVVSFKHTHLVERIGLLTLIVMGEGIIGMTKSVSRILQNSSSTTSSDIATIVSSVLLIYYIWVLYFDQIENDRFGTIRQQIWAMLHYPLHVGILLTVEGSTALILWNIISRIDSLLWYWYPTTGALSDYTYYYNDTQQVIDWINEGIDQVASNFKPGALEDAYDYKVNLTAIENLTEKFGTHEWEVKTDEIVYDMWLAIDNFIFANFGIELPETDKHVNGKGTGDESSQNTGLFNVFVTVFTYFYIAAGAFLIVLAVMYWFGKTHKTRGEWASIGVRTFAGIGLTMTTVGLWYCNAYYPFVYSPWLIPVAMLSFFVVIVADNLLVWHSNKTIAKMTSANRNRQLSEGSVLHDGQDQREDVGERDMHSSGSELVMEESRRGDHNV